MMKNNPHVDLPWSSDIFLFVKDFDTEYAKINEVCYLDLLNFSLTLVSAL